jgi:hypothetical protein
MTIAFNCASCGKEVKAPDSAAGKRGKCPFCQQSVQVPAPPPPQDDDGLFKLAPLDEDDERRRQEEIRKLKQAERELLAESRDDPSAKPPLDQRDDVQSPDVHHLVVNYCLDMAEGNLTRANVTAGSLRKFGPVGVQAVDEFAAGKAAEPALKKIPPRVLQGFLAELKSKLR